jgi:hypothetical protein
MRLRVLLATVLLIFATQVDPAKATDGCGFGKEFAGDGSSTCVKNLWKLEKYNDGFSKYVAINLNPEIDLSDNAELFNTLTIKCEKKKLHVYIFMDGYIDITSFEMTSSGSVIDNGSLTLKIDNGKVQKWNWKRRFNNEIELSSPEKFLLGLTKSKSKISLKISREDAPSILVYPKSDILKFRSDFIQAGCKY